MVRKLFINQFYHVNYYDFYINYYCQRNVKLKGKEKNKDMKKLFKSISYALSGVLVCIFSFGVYAYEKCPSTINTTNGGDINIAWDLPITTKIVDGNDILNTNVSNTNSINQTGELMLFDCIPIKQVSINYTDIKYVTPCGTPFGIKIYTNGLVVVGISDIETSNGTKNPCKDAGIKEGDIITKINNKNVTTNEDILNAVKNSNGKSLKFSICRNNKNIITNILPVKSKTGEYKVGLWVRDSCAGIGTLTFYDNDNNKFAGLGHGICDIDTNELMPVLKGEIVKASIISIKKGIVGTPGELCGIFTDNTVIGNVTLNDELGIYGNMDSCPINAKKLPVAKKQQVQKGYAQILTTIDDGEPKYYDIEIVSVDYSENQETKNMVIKIVDEELLNKTGGIVQGMSGSPIIQNEQLVGAVTHVFVNNPTQGYGVFAENMLKLVE